MPSNYELFEAFYEEVKNSKNIVEVIKAYGGGTIYVPSFKTTHRNEEIRRRFEEGADIPTLQREYGLSRNQIYAILKKS